MLFSTALLALVPAVIATTIRIDVGLGGLVFTPNNVNAAPGDVLEFHYHPKNHSVMQSSFQSPCHALPGGIDSGFVPVPTEADAATTQHFSVVVNNTKPLWIFCAQGTHCKQGMSMVVNQPAPPSKNTLAAYQAAAASQNSTAGPVIEGGLFSNGTSSSSSSGSGSSSSLALTTYTTAFTTYTTSSAGVATVVSLSSTVTQLSSTATVAAGTAAGTASSTVATASTAVSSGGAAGPLDMASWAMVAGVAVAGGLIF